MTLMTIFSPSASISKPILHLQYFQTSGISKLLFLVPRWVRMVQILKQPRPQNFGDNFRKIPRFVIIVFFFI
eukprot:14182.XXX_461767_461982_1 [CDS] Oithona nana genome sequencing.